MDNQLCQFGCVFRNFTDASCGVLAYLYVHIFQTVEDAGENLSLNDNFRKVNGVLRNLSQAGADLALELGIWVRNQGSQVRDSTVVNNVLSKLLSMLGNLGQSGS